MENVFEIELTEQEAEYVLDALKAEGHNWVDQERHTALLRVASFLEMQIQALRRFLAMNPEVS